MMHDTRVAWSNKLLLVCCFVVVMSYDASAQLLYDFLEDGTGTLLATLELSSLPATHEEVVALTFTPQGEVILGFGPTYDGGFDVTSGSFVADGAGGLTGSVDGSSIFDFTPEQSILLPNGTFLFRLDANPPGSPLDFMTAFPEIGIGNPIGASGNWRLVPEPSLTGLCLIAVLFGVPTTRRRKRNMPL